MLVVDLLTCTTLYEHLTPSNLMHYKAFIGMFHRGGLGYGTASIRPYNVLK